MEEFMRTGNLHPLVSFVFGILILLPLSFSQQCQPQTGSAKPKKVLTPEQKVYQQQWREYMAKRQSLQAQAKQIFDTEMAREQTGDCPDAQNTYDFNICYGNQVTITDQNLKSYEGTIQDLMSPMPKMPGKSADNIPGPAGPSFTPEQVLEEFNHVEEAWRQYREKACTAAYHQFGGGTGGPSFEGQCELKLARDHMRELDLVYGHDLHL
jgi:uncharacterized protein YecT (DUF1311 family)